MTSKIKLRKWLSVGAIGCSSLLLAVGCGSETETAESSSAIDDYLGTNFFSDFNSDTFEDDFEAQERQAEENIAACMTKEGFEYTPATPFDFSSFEAEDGIEPGTKEWTAKYGFGYSTQIYSQTQVGPGLVGYDDTAFDVDNQPEDPNQAYVESLDEAGQQAYTAALYGEDSFATEEEAFDEDVVEEEFVDAFEPQGCQGESFDLGDDFAFFEEFGDELDELFAQVEFDTKVVEKIDEARSCATKAGFELPAGFPDPTNDSGEFVYQTELNAVDALVDNGEDIFEDIDYESLSEDELDALFAKQNIGTEFTPEAKTLLAEVQEKEINLAVAVSECGGSQEEMFNLFNEVLREYEDQFIETYKDRLDTFKASQASE